MEQPLRGTARSRSILPRARRRDPAAAESWSSGPGWAAPSTALRLSANVRPVSTPPIAASTRARAARIAVQTGPTSSPWCARCRPSVSASRSGAGLTTTHMTAMNGAIAATTAAAGSKPSRETLARGGAGAAGVPAPVPRPWRSGRERQRRAGDDDGAVAARLDGGRVARGDDDLGDTLVAAVQRIAVARGRPEDV
jgi:hypothetical protein